MRTSLMGVAAALTLMSALAAHAQDASSAAPRAAQGSAAGQGAAGQSSTDSGTQVTGIVKEIDKNGGKMVVNDQTYVLGPSGGTAMVPARGDEITFFYEERDGQKVVTRIGQKQQ